MHPGLKVYPVYFYLCRLPPMCNLINSQKHNNVIHSFYCCISYKKNHYIASLIKNEGKPKTLQRHQRKLKIHNRITAARTMVFRYEACYYIAKSMIYHRYTWYRRYTLVRVVPYPVWYGKMFLCGTPGESSVGHCGSC